MRTINEKDIRDHNDIRMFAGFEWVEEWDGSFNPVSWWYWNDMNHVRILYSDMVAHIVTYDYFKSIRRGLYNPNVIR